MAKVHFQGKHSDRYFEVDDQDVERVSHLRWYLTHSGGKEYAVWRKMIKGQQTAVYLQHFVMPHDPDRKTVFVIDGNPLNCRRENLTRDNPRKREVERGDTMRDSSRITRNNERPRRKKGPALPSDEENLENLLSKRPVNRAVEYLYNVNQTLIRILEEHQIEWVEAIRQLNEETTK